MIGLLGHPSIFVIEKDVENQNKHTFLFYDTYTFFCIMGPKYMKKRNYDVGHAIYLIIVESPSKCAKIESYLGQNYKCIASRGHIRELGSLKNIDTKNDFAPTFTIIKEKKRSCPRNEGDCRSISQRKCHYRYR